MRDRTRLPAVELADTLAIAVYQSTRAPPGDEQFRQSLSVASEDSSDVLNSLIRLPVQMNLLTYHLQPTAFSFHASP